MRVIRSQAKRQRAKSFFCGEDFRYKIKSKSPRGSIFDFAMNGYQFKNCEIKLPGTFQVENAAVALAGLILLKEKFNFSISEDRIRKAFLQADWPARFEIIQKGQKTFVLDGAHNVDSIRALVRNIKGLFPGRSVVTVFGISREKNLKAILPILSSCSNALIATKTSHLRAQILKRLVESVKPYFDLTVATPAPKEALRYLANFLSPSKIGLITGSLFLVGEAREILKS